MRGIYSFRSGLLLCVLFLAGCFPDNEVPIEVTMTSAEDIQPGTVASVVGVKVTGNNGAYQFSVEVSSPDLGCEQYADWWEVISEGGELIYRRVLLHSHVNEQPFTRSGGPVPIEADDIVWIRAHLHPEGYGGVAFKGSVRDGFQAAELRPDFAVELTDHQPLPDGCDF